MPNLSSSSHKHYQPLPLGTALFLLLIAAMPASISRCRAEGLFRRLIYALRMQALAGAPMGAAA